MHIRLATVALGMALATSTRAEPPSGPQTAPAAATEPLAGPSVAPAAQRRSLIERDADGKIKRLEVAPAEAAQLAVKLVAFVGLAQTLAGASGASVMSRSVSADE